MSRGMQKIYRDFFVAFQQGIRDRENLLLISEIEVIDEKEYVKR